MEAKDIRVERFQPQPGERVRSENLALIEVDCAVVHQEVGGRLAAQGTTQLEVYESDLPRIFDMVACPEKVSDDEVRCDESAIAAVKARFQDERDRYLHEKRTETGKDGTNGRQRLEWPDVVWTYKGPRNWIEKYYEMHSNHIDGPADGIPPLRRVKVLKRNLPPALTHDEQRAHAAANAGSETQATAIASALLTVFQQAGLIANPEPPAKGGAKTRRGKPDS